MTDNKKPLIIMLAVTLLLVLGASVVYAMNRNVTPDADYTNLAQCITESVAKFYGAFWCQHCNNQKAAFGSAAEHVPYVECSTADGQGQTEMCAAEGIRSYPTWVFGNNTELTGNIALASLAKITGCEMPEA